MGIDPDNVATPVAAALGDLVTLALLAGVASVLFLVHPAVHIIILVLYLGNLIIQYFKIHLFEPFC